jgi:hypothetical protein
MMTHVQDSHSVYHYPRWFFTQVRFIDWIWQIVRQIVCVCGENNVQHVDTISSPTCSTTCCTTNRTVCGPLYTRLLLNGSPVVWRASLKILSTYHCVRLSSSEIKWSQDSSVSTVSDSGQDTRSSIRGMTV